MSTVTYRAAFFVSDNGDTTVLTGPEHASLTDDELLDEALAVALEAGIVDLDETDPEIAYPRLTLDQFNDGLAIGEWTE